MSHGVKGDERRILRFMPQTDKLITCANCARPVREGDAKDAGWRYWSDGIDLHPPRVFWSDAKHRWKVECFPHSERT